jgi:hypothetical protein
MEGAELPAEVVEQVKRCIQSYRTDYPFLGIFIPATGSDVLITGGDERVRGEPLGVRAYGVLEAIAERGGSGPGRVRSDSYSTREDFIF